MYPRKQSPVNGYVLHRGERKRVAREDFGDAGRDCIGLFGAFISIDSFCFVISLNAVLNLVDGDAAFDIFFGGFDEVVRRCEIIPPSATL